MKKFLWKLGFRKMDEMEQHIAFKAQRNALVFLLIALFIWTLYESYKVYAFHTPLNLFPCFLLVAASSIQTLSQLIIARNAVKGAEDSVEASPVMKIVVAICVIIAVAVTVGVVLTVMGAGV